MSRVLVSQQCLDGNDGFEPISFLLYCHFDRIPEREKDTQERL